MIMVYYIDISHRIHVWYISLHLHVFYGIQMYRYINICFLRYTNVYIYRYINICSSHGFIMGIFQPCPKKDGLGKPYLGAIFPPNEAMLPGHIEAVAWAESS